MGYPDEKQVDGSLPTYVPIPSDHDTPLSELPRTEQRRRRLRVFIKHAAAFLITALVFCHLMKKGTNKGYEVVRSKSHTMTCGNVSFAL